MTEQEAQAWALQLAKWWTIDETTKEAHREGSLFWFNGNTREGYRFSYWQDLGLDVAYACLARFEEGEETGRLEVKDGFVPSVPFDVVRNQESYQEFATQHMPFFRRGCWLSGCPIDASAHEKAEWMQGFSQEELEAWNLKM